MFTVTVGAVSDLTNTALPAPVTTLFTTGNGVDLAPPTVVAVAPANGATGVAVAATVVVTFNERMNPLTINNGTLQLVEYFTGVRVAGDVVASSDGKSAGFVPTGALKPDTLYYISGNGFTDLTGQPTSLFTTFRTTP